MTDPIVKTLDLDCDAARAFAVFVERIATWWPLDGHAVSASAGKTAQSVVIEPRVGGAIYEIMHDGKRTDWGRVLVYTKGRHLATTWHPGNNAGNPTRLDVSFEDIGAGKSRLTLTHSGWEVWAERADEMRGSYDGGWDHVLSLYAGAAKPRS